MVFSTVFKDDDDVVIGKVFMQVGPFLFYRHLVDCDWRSYSQKFAIAFKVKFFSTKTNCYCWCLLKFTYFLYKSKNTYHLSCYLHEGWRKEGAWIEKQRLTWDIICLLWTAAWLATFPAGCSVEDEEENFNCSVEAQLCFVLSQYHLLETVLLDFLNCYHSSGLNYIFMKFIYNIYLITWNLLDVSHL